MNEEDHKKKVIQLLEQVYVNVRHVGENVFTGEDAVGETYLFTVNGEFIQEYTESDTTFNL